DFYPELTEITAAHQKCPGLAERQARERIDMDAERLATLARRAARYPNSVSTQTRWADELVAQGRAEQARAVLERAAERMPWETELAYELSKRVLAEDGLEAARQVIRDAL